MPTNIVTAPTGYPVTLEEAKESLRVTHSDDDARIARHISSATDFVQGRTGRALFTQTVDFYLDCFTDKIILPTSPISSITSVKYLAVESNSPDLQTLATTIYQSDLLSVPPTISLIPGQSWPSTRDVINAVVIRFVAGYGVAGSVPSNFKDAILLKVEQLYDRNPENDSIIDQAIDALILKDRLWYV